MCFSFSAKDVHLLEELDDLAAASRGMGCFCKIKPILHLHLQLKFCQFTCSPILFSYFVKEVYHTHRLLCPQFWTSGIIEITDLMMFLFKNWFQTAAMEILSTLMRRKYHLCVSTFFNFNSKTNDLPNRVYISFLCYSIYRWWNMFWN